MAEPISAIGAQPSSGQNVEGPAVVVERGKDGKKIYRINTEFVIEGRIQKPNAFYILHRQGVNYGWDKLNKSFVQSILESVTELPF